MPEAPDCEQSCRSIGRGRRPDAQRVQQRLAAGHRILARFSGDPEHHGWRRPLLHGEDDREARRVAVLGSDAAKQLFAGRPALGETIRIGDFPYVVIGVMEFKEQDSSYDGRDVNKVFAPFTAVLRDFPNKPPMPPDTIDQMLATPKNAELHDECKTADSPRACPHPQLRSE